MNNEKIEFTEQEILALVSAYYSACYVVSELTGIEEVPKICPENFWETLMKMQPRLLKLSEKYGHFENIA